eukprot:1448962-Pleurochrysis_carterae.AAC.1
MQVVTCVTTKLPAWLSTGPRVSLVHGIRAAYLDSPKATLAGRLCKLESLGPFREQLPHAPCERSAISV